MLESLKFIQETGKTSKFISDFRKFCYNAKINNVIEQKRYFYKSLPNYDVLFELIKRGENINLINDLFKEFEDLIGFKAIYLLFFVSFFLLHL